MEYFKAFLRGLIFRETPFFIFASYILLGAFICTCILEYYVVLSIIKQLK